MRLGSAAWGQRECLCPLASCVVRNKWSTESWLLRLLLWAQLSSTSVKFLLLEEPYTHDCLIRHAFGHLHHVRVGTLCNVCSKPAQAFSRRAYGICPVLIQLAVLVRLFFCPMIDVPLAYLAIFPDSQARGLDVVPQTIARFRSGGDPETADLLEKIIYPVGHARKTTVSNRLAHVEVCALERPHRAAVLFLSCLQCTSVIFEVVAHKLFIALGSF